MFKLLGLSPLSDTGQAVAVVAGGQNSKPETTKIFLDVGVLTFFLPSLPLRFVQNNFHTDPAGFLFRSGHSEGELHVVFVFLQTVSQVESPLVQVGGMEAGLAAPTLAPARKAALHRRY